jgi:two-component system, cell cycle response regulator DivK
MTGNRENLLSGTTDASRVFPRRISQEGHVAARKYQESHPCSGWHPLCLTLFDMANRTKKILIVDNNDAWRDTLGGFIKGLGHEVFEAATGLEAVDRASSLRPDLIMMDLSLPEMNGDEATVRLKRNASTRNIPVVINTSWSMSCNVGDRADRALDAGAEEILYKPFHLTALREVLRTYLLG